MTLEFYDARFGDTYVIYLEAKDGELQVSRIVRYVEKIGRDPIYYDRVEDLPNRARSEIDQLIHERTSLPHNR